MPTYRVSTEDDNNASEKDNKSVDTSQDSTQDDTSTVSSSTSQGKENDQKTDTQISQDTAGKLKNDITKDVTDNVSKTVSESIIQKIGSALGLTEKQAKDELPKDPETLEKFINDRVEKTLKARQDAEDEEVKQTESQRQEQVDSIITSWHGQYNILARAGKVPQIKDAKNPNDPGVVARRKLIQEIGNIIKENKESGDVTLANYTPTIHDAVGRTPGIRGVAGADLPVSGNTSSRESDSAFTNKEIRGKSFMEIAAEGAV